VLHVTSRSPADAALPPRIGEEAFRYERDQENIRREAALDGVRVIRIGVDA